VAVLATKLQVFCHLCHPVGESAASYGCERNLVRLSDAETYEKYAGELVRFATGLVGPDDAADVVADAFVRVLGSASWPDVDKQRAYLYRAVLNEVRMRHRSTMRRRARELRAFDRLVLEDVEVRPEVLEAMSVLSTQQRAAVILTYWEDLTPGEVAGRLGVSEGSVRRHLARGRSKLREVLHG
jgi:RNA polymerase sigma factor (sigma-70 family)